MTGSELTMLLSHYPDIEIMAFDLESYQPEPVSGIVFNAADESLLLLTFPKRPK